MKLTIVHSGRPSGVTSLHVPPPSLDTCTKLSSVPAQSRPGSMGDSAKA